MPLTALLCGHGVLLTVNGNTQAVPVCQVSENFFTTFGVRPAAGRAWRKATNSIPKRRLS